MRVKRGAKRGKQGAPPGNAGILPASPAPGAPPGNAGILPASPASGSTEVPPGLPASRSEVRAGRRDAGVPGTLLAALCLLALGLRAWGLGWGLPGPERSYPYHPDETVLLHALCQVSPILGDVAPGFYSYGSLTLLWTRFIFDLLVPFVGWGTVPRNADFATWVGDFAHLLSVGRWVAVLLGVAAVPVAGRLASRLYGRSAGMWAAGFTAVTPMLVYLGHYLAVDVPSATLALGALALGAGALTEEDAGRARIGAPSRERRHLAGKDPTSISAPSRERRHLAGKDLAAAAFVAGLGVGVKYALAPLFLALLVPWWRLGRRDGAPARFRGLALLGLAGALGFLIATPGCLLEPVRFLADVQQELRYNREGMGLVFQATPPAAWVHLGASLPIGLEWPLYVLGLAGVGVALRRRTPGDLMLLAFLMPLFLLLSASERKYLRYVCPLLPVLAVLAARVVTEFPVRYARAGPLLGGIAAGAALLSSIAHAGLFAAPDPRDQARAYLRAAVRPGETIALGADPWYWTPPLHPSAGCVLLGALYGGPPIWEQSPPGTARPDVFPLGEFHVLAPPPGAGGLNPAVLARYRPRFVIVSDYNTEDPERIRRSDPSFRHPILDLQPVLQADYALVQRFRSRPSVPGFTWWRSGTPPHDWRYPMPEVWIWERR